MKTKNMTPSEKAKKTKLSKKSVEELVAIIFRKDDVEKSLRAKNVEICDKYAELAAEYTNLQEKYSIVREECVKEKNLALKEMQNKMNNLEAKLGHSSAYNVDLRKSYVELADKYNITKRNLYCLAAAAFVAGILFGILF